MNTLIIEYPEIGRTYVGRRHLGGPKADRYEAVLVIDDRVEITGERSIVVKWLIDEQVETLWWYVGLLTEITPQWRKSEILRHEETIARSTRALEVLRALR